MKIILTVLGYTTRHSISTIRSKKKIEQFEHEILQMQNNELAFQNIQRRFPQIVNLLPFASGIKVVLWQIIQSINKSEHHIIQEYDTAHILRSAKDVNMIRLFELRKKIFILI